MALPDDFIRGPRDGLVILSLWCLRTSSLLFFLLGLCWLVLSNQLDEDLAARLDSPAELAGSLTTPLAGVALALLTRATAAGLGWATAAPLVIQDVPPLVGIDGQSTWRQWTDRWRQISATATVRGTWAVRRTAIASAPVWGPRLRRLDVGLRAGCVIAAVAFVGVLVVVGQ